MRYILLTPKLWHDRLFLDLSQRTGETWIRLKEKEEFVYEKLELIKPDCIFIPHWSHIIPVSIYNSFPCIVFHMTDLPYGRGGSPLQNLILNGHGETMISAIKVSGEIDAGDIYLKKPLTLQGSATEIFERSVPVLKKMIEELIELKPHPVSQTGKAVFFKRRKPAESNIAGIEEVKKMYDYIRMLDGEGYPPAFLETDHFRFEFTKAAITSDKVIEAHVRIIKK